MTTSAHVACVLVGCVLAIPVALAGDEEGINAKDAFSRLKKLEGEWKVSHSEKSHGEMKNEVFKVTAAGSSLMETTALGTKHEMVTMYHLDGKDLIAVHYCAAGNAPRLKLDLKNSKPDFLSFIFDGGSNLDPAKDMHIHALRIKFLEGGKVESEWDAFMDGKLTDTVKIPLSRP